jgi:hypothetical protein
MPVVVAACFSAAGSFSALQKCNGSVEPGALIRRAEHYFEYSLPFAQTACLEAMGQMLFA